MKEDYYKIFNVKLNILIIFFISKIVLKNIVIYSIIRKVKILFGWYYISTFIKVGSVGLKLWWNFSNEQYIFKILIKAFFYVYLYNIYNLIQKNKI